MTPATTTTPAATQPVAAPVAGSEFLTFALGNEGYGIDILKVQEIRGYEAVTAIPNAPAYLKGVINLRGTIVPILDLRIKLSFEKVEYDRFTVVIILNVGKRVVGIVVDSVSDVLTLTADQMKPAPDFSASFDTRYITGLGAVGSRTIILMDIEKLVDSHELGAAAAVSTH